MRQRRQWRRALALRSGSRLSGHEAGNGFLPDRFLVEEHLEPAEPFAQLARLEQMVRRRRTDPERALMDREGLVEDEATRYERLANRREQIPLQISRDQQQLEPRQRQWSTGEVRAPPADRQSLERGARRSLSHDLRRHIHSKGPISGARENQRVAAAAHGDIQRAPRVRDGRCQSVQPLHDEGRRVIL